MEYNMPRALGAISLDTSGDSGLLQENQQIAERYPTETSNGTMTFNALPSSSSSTLNQNIKIEMDNDLHSGTSHSQCFINRQTDPPRTEVVENRLPTLTFPFINTSQLQPINISIDIKIPETRLSQLPPADPQGSDRLRGHSWDTYPYPIICRSILRSARQQALSRIGIHSYSKEKRLLAAVKNSDVCTVIRLLQDGVSPNGSDAKKRTPLHIAASQGLDHIVSCLTAMRADPNKLDILGNTPLHLAASRGDTRVVRILVGSGADVLLKDRMGRTPLDIVQSRLNMSRRNKSISTDNLIGECRMIVDILKIHAARYSQKEALEVDALCDMMAGVSTREQVDELAESVLKQMANLCCKSDIT